MQTLTHMCQTWEQLQFVYMHISPLGCVCGVHILCSLFGQVSTVVYINVDLVVNSPPDSLFALCKTDIGNAFRSWQCPALNCSAPANICRANADNRGNVCRLMFALIPIAVVFINFHQIVRRGNGGGNNIWRKYSS